MPPLRRHDLPQPTFPVRSFYRHEVIAAAETLLTAGWTPHWISRVLDVPASTVQQWRAVKRRADLLRTPQDTYLDDHD